MRNKPPSEFEFTNFRRFNHRRQRLYRYYSLAESGFCRRKTGLESRMRFIASYQDPIVFGLLECSAGISPAIISRSMSEESPDLPKRLRKATNFEILGLCFEKRQHNVFKATKNARVAIICIFLLCSAATAVAKPKEVSETISPSVGRDIEVHVDRGGFAEVVLEGIAMPRDTVQFKVVKSPQHGTLGEPRRINKDKVAFLYRHNGKKGGEQDRVDFSLKTGPSNAWGRVKAKIFISEPKSRLVLEPESLDFGEVPIGANKSLSLRLRNAGGGIITGTAEISPTWSVDGEPAFSLAEGATCDFSVTFAPTGPETQNGRIVFHTGQQPEPFVPLHGKGTYRFLAPPQASILRDGVNALGVLRLESQSKKPLELRLKAASPVLVPMVVLLGPGAMVEIPLGLEKKNYTESRVALTVSDGAAVREVRVNLPPPPAVLELEEGPFQDIGGIPFRNVPEIEIGLRNAGAGVAFVSLADGEGGLFLAPSQPRNFELAPGASAPIRTVWKLPETPGEAEARITALEGGLVHPLKLLAQVESPKPEQDAKPSEKITETTTPPEPSRKGSVKLRRRSDKEIQDVSNKNPGFETEPVVGWFSVDLKVIWTYKGPKPADFVVEVWGIAPRNKLSSETFENRLKVPEELPPMSVAGWVQGGEAVEGPDGWEATIKNLLPGYHTIRLGTRPPGQELYFYSERKGGVFVPAPPDWPKQALGAAAVLLVGVFAFRRKIRGLFYQESSD